MRSRRTGSRSIRALPPTLPPAISTCVRRRSRHDAYAMPSIGNEFVRAGADGAGRHHDDGSVRQSQLLLLHVELSYGEDVAHDPYRAFAVHVAPERRLGNEFKPQLRADADERRGSFRRRATDGLLTGVPAMLSP